MKTGLKELVAEKKENGLSSKNNKQRAGAILVITINPKGIQAQNISCPTLIRDCRQAILHWSLPQASLRGFKPPGYRVLYKHRFMFLL